MSWQYTQRTINGVKKSYLYNSVKALSVKTLLVFGGVFLWFFDCKTLAHIYT